MNVEPRRWLITVWLVLSEKFFKVSVVICAWLLLAVIVIGPYGLSPVFANGGADLISSQEAGPYRIDVSILPGRAVVGQTHFSIFIQSLSNGQALTRATILISATGPPGSTGVGPIPAPNDNSPQFFETNVPFDLEGDWQVSIDVSAELGDVTILLPLSVSPGGGIDLIYVAAAAVAILALGIWTWDRLSGKKSRNERQ